MTNVDLSPTSIVIVFMVLQVSRALFAEAIYSLSPNRQSPPISSNLLVFNVELLKCLMAFIMVCRTSKKYSFTEKLFYFVPSAALFYLNRALYYWILKDTSAGALSLFLQMRIPSTALIHHIVIQRQRSLAAWVSIIIVFGGVMIALMDGNLEIRNSWVPFIALIICINSAFASIFNEILLKSLDMPFWDQQLRMSFLGLLFSSFTGWSTDSIRLNSGSITPGTITAVIGCIILASISSLFTGFLVLKLDNIVKVIANTVNTIIITLLGYVIFGVFTFQISNFVCGTLLVVIGSYMYCMHQSIHASLVLAADKACNGLIRRVVSSKILRILLVLLVVSTWVTLSFTDSNVFYADLKETVDTQLNRTAESD
jgi:UDP-galactose transporter